MLTKLAEWGRSARYWQALILLCLTMIGVALVYQYVLDHLPCLLCIQVRILVIALMLVALIGLALRRTRFGSTLAHLAALAVSGVFFERAWALLGIERGTRFGDCSFDLGLPAWFALDHWFPWLFKVWDACGYTPVLAFGVTMAQALVALSALLCVVSLVLMVAVARGRR